MRFGGVSEERAGSAATATNSWRRAVRTGQIYAPPDHGSRSPFYSAALSRAPRVCFSFAGDFSEYSN